MRNKFTRSLALGMAFATAFTFTAPNTALFNTTVAEAAVAKKATKGTSKITASAKKVTVNVGKTKTVKVTLNKKQKKAVKVTLKSNKSAVAKVAKSVTVKKNAKTASFKITGKKAGTATITASFKTSTNKTKKATIKVTVKNVNADNVTVNENKIKIEDQSGLQSDGTALIKDTLRVNIPADLGTMENIIWYCDGSAQNTASLIEKDATQEASKEGTWYAVAVSTKGTTYKSNEIKVTETEAPAVIKSFTIEDDYDTPSIEYKNADKKAIVTVTLNKAYDGKLRLSKKVDKNFTSIDANDEINTESKGVLGATGVGAPADKSTYAVDSKYTNARLMASTANNGAALRYIASNGEASYKYVVDDAGVLRGTEYVVSFDQNSITTDTPGKGKENKSEGVVAPYLTAPAKIEMTKVSGTNLPEITFYDADSNVMNWLGDKNVNTADTLAECGIAEAKIYKSKSNTTVTTAKDVDEAESSTAAKLDKGVWTGTKNADTTAYWFATVKTEKNLFGADAITLTSAAKQVAQSAATHISVKQNGDTATTATVKFNNLRCDGKVYIIRSNAYGAASDSAAHAAAYAYNKFDSADSSTYEKVADVKAGTQTVNVDNAISKIEADDVATTNVHEQFNNVYMAMFIPEDEANYGKVSTGVYTADPAQKWAINGDDPDGLASEPQSFGTRIVKKLATYKISTKAKDLNFAASNSDAILLSGGATVISAAASTASTSDAIFDLEDQFGETYAHSLATAGQAVTWTLDAKDASNLERTVKVEYKTYAISGGADSIKIYGITTSGAGLGQKWIGKLNDKQNLVLECTKAGKSNSNSANCATFKLTIEDVK